MGRRIGTACVVSLLGVALLAQTQQPPVFRAGASLVRVDVTVTDRHGEAATSLTADDFELEEDGIPQTVQTFKFVSADGRRVESDDTSLAIRSPEHAAAEAARDEVRVFLIFWDEYHIGRMASAIQGRKALTKFVGTAFGPTDLVALMDPLLPSDAIVFTRNYGDLIRKIHKLEGRFHEYLPPRSAAEEAMLERAGHVERLRSEVTISALKGAAYRLGSLREGRKAIIFVSEGLPGLDLHDRFPLLQDLMQAANNNNTAIYTVDPRGLTGFASDDLRMLANETGGQAFVNTNAPERLMRQVVKDASAFYLLGYASTRNPADGKFHKIKVRVMRPGLDVRARQGYWAPTITEIDRAAKEAAAVAPAEVTTALSVLSMSRPERVVDLWIGTARAADGAAQVTLAWTPRPETGRDRALHGTMSVVAGAGDRRPIEASIDAGRLAWNTAPGTYVLHTLVRDAQGQTIDEDTRELSVPDFAAAPLALSSPAVLRVRNPSELKTVTGGADVTPFAGREFVRTDRLFLRFALYGSRAAEATVSARLLSRAGSALLPLTIRLRAAGGGLYEIDLPLASVARGDFLIAIDAVAGDDRTETLVPVRIVS